MLGANGTHITDETSCASSATNFVESAEETEL